VLGLIGKTLGSYTILEQIGQGGMSSVFKALDLDNQNHVAVKVLSPYIAHEQRFRARFEREVKLLRRLQHSNIVPILDFGETEGLAYIVMPLIGTGTLHDRLQNGPLDVQTGARVTAQVASALSLAHSMGVIHRDVKPSNVLLDQEGNALLSDFSFAHHQDASQNLTGSALIGTPAYMSPEQCRGDAIDAAGDAGTLELQCEPLHLPGAAGRNPLELRGRRERARLQQAKGERRKVKGEAGSAQGGNEVALGVGRQMLHAWKLAFRHPRTGERVELEAPLPPDFTDALAVLRAAGARTR